jgi:Cu/Ag efflux pump CusA
VRNVTSLVATCVAVQRPLATVVIGGILSSTVLGLMVLPVMLRLLLGSRPVSEE